MTTEHQQQQKVEILKRLGWRFLNFWSWVGVVLFSFWATGAVYFHEFLPAWLSPLLAILFAVTIIVILVKFTNRLLARSIVAGMIVLVYLSWIWIVPRSDRNWIDQHQKMAMISPERQSGDHLQPATHEIPD